MWTQFYFSINIKICYDENLLNIAKQNMKAKSNIFAYYGLLNDRSNYLKLLLWPNTRDCDFWSRIKSFKYSKININCLIANLYLDDYFVEPTAIIACLSYHFAVFFMLNAHLLFIYTHFIYSREYVYLWICVEFHAQT